MLARFHDVENNQVQIYDSVDEFRRQSSKNGERENGIQLWSSLANQVKGNFPVLQYRTIQFYFIKS